MEDFKKQVQKDKDFVEKEHTKIITKLEEELRIARSGFDAEREALEKKREDMKAQYEQQISEMKRSRIEEIQTLTSKHKKEVDDLNDRFEERLMSETEEIRRTKEQQIVDLKEANNK
jgi:hypothetical protein